jgi:hypothetical protein
MTNCCAGCPELTYLESSKRSWGAGAGHTTLFALFTLAMLHLIVFLCHLSRLTLAVMYDNDDMYAICQNECVMSGSVKHSIAFLLEFGQ